MRLLAASALAFFLTACGGAPSDSEPAPPPAAPAAIETPSTDRLDAILAAQPEAVQARYQYRHPKETLEFFGVEPGMTVIEALPGAGWYSKMLIPYLGADGTLIGADYAIGLWSQFGFMSEEAIQKKQTWPADWTARAETWRGEDGARVAAFALGSLPPDMAGSVDVVLFIRALHNMARFEADGGFLSEAIRDAYTALKPGGIAGVVQHHARDDMPDDWASGANGYLKKDFVIATMEAAGFELVAWSDINANDQDQPTSEDIVWRLPPSLAGSDQDEYQRARLEEIGESNRMTLKFRKPEQG